MNKAVMLSIQPKWCELIASCEKTIEVRKTRPKLETPFKCYIYCTSKKIKAVPMNSDHIVRVKIKPLKHAPIKRIANRYPWFQKVIGEFVCDRIDEIKCDNGIQAYFNNREQTCLSDFELRLYATDGKSLYFWHISDLVIYDKPKELGEFKRQNACYKSGSIDKLGCWEKCCVRQEAGECDSRYSPLTRPPQSWMYIEEV